MSHIVLEGPDGVGKTALAREVALLTGALYTREPFDRDYRGQDPSWFERDRRDHWNLVLKPALWRGVDIVQDRGALSALAYNNPTATEADVNRFLSTAPYQPTATIIILRSAAQAVGDNEFEAPDRLRAATAFYERVAVMRGFSYFRNDYATVAEASRALAWMISSGGC